MIANDEDRLRIYSRILSPEQKAAVVKGLLSKGLSIAQIEAKDSRIGLLDPKVRILLNLPREPAFLESAARVAGMPFRGWSALGQLAAGAAIPSDVTSTIIRAGETAKGAPPPETTPLREKIGKLAGSMVPTFPLWGRLMALPTFTARAVPAAALAATEAKLIEPERTLPSLGPPAAISAVLVGGAGRFAPAFQQYLFNKLGPRPWMWWLKSKIKPGTLPGLKPREAWTPAEIASEERLHASAITGPALSPSSAAYIIGNKASRELAVGEATAQVTPEAAMMIKSGRADREALLNLVRSPASSKYLAKPGEPSITVTVPRLGRVARTEEEEAAVRQGLREGLAFGDSKSINAATVAFDSAQVNVAGMDEPDRLIPLRDLLSTFTSEVRRLNPFADPGRAMDDMTQLMWGKDAIAEAMKQMPEAVRPAYTFERQMNQTLTVMANNPKYFRTVLADAIQHQPGKAGLIRGFTEPTEREMPAPLPFIVKGEGPAKEQIRKFWYKPDEKSVEIMKKGEYADLGAFDRNVLEFSRIVNRVDPSQTISHRVVEPMQRMEILAQMAENNAGKKIKSIAPEFVDNPTLKQQLWKYIENKEGDRERILKQFGPDLSGRMEEITQFIRKGYYHWVNRVNRIRRYYGQDPVHYRPDYVTHLREMNAMRWAFGDTLRIPPKDLEQYMGFAAPTDKYFRFALRRVGDRAIEDPLTAYTTYVGHAARLSYVTPYAQKLRATAEEGISKATHPFMREAFVDAAQAAQGIRSRAEEGKFWDEVLSSPMGKWIRDTKNDIVQNLIVGNLSTVINQTGSLPLLVGTVGYKNTLMGALRLVDPTYRAMLYKILDNRSLNLMSRRQMMHEFSPDPTRLKGIPMFMSKVLSAADSEISTIAFSAGLLDATERGMAGHMAIRHADLVAHSVNRLYMASETPRLIRQRWFPIVAPLQQYIINGMNFVLNDLLRGKGPAGANPLMMGIRFGTSWALLSAVAASLGVKAPFDVGDLIPLFRGGRFSRGWRSPITGEIQLLPVSTLLDLSSGMLQMATGDFEKGRKKAFRAGMMVYPRGGGIEMWRLLSQGRLLPKREGEEAVTGLDLGL